MLEDQSPVLSKTFAHGAPDNYIECWGFGECIYCGLDSQVDVLRNRIFGRVLTIVDSAIPQGAQNKSVKDLIKQLVEEDIWSFSKDMTRAINHTCEKVTRSSGSVSGK